jgi:hypothetical protein
MKSQLVRFSREPMIVERECPDYDDERRACMAATGPLTPSHREQMRYCSTSDYDNCPIHLSKVLRSSSSLGFVGESLVNSGK